MSLRGRVSALAIALLANECAAQPSQYYVSPDGNDQNPGTSDSPFATISQCASAAEKCKRTGGAVCNIRSGVYPESVSIGEGPVTFRTESSSSGERDGEVIVTGLDTLTGLDWKPSTDPRLSYGGADATGCVFAAEISASQPQDFEQLFLNGSMMVEARWPNVDVKNVASSWLSKSTWQPTGNGSMYGEIDSPDLASQGFSWSGGLAVLNVAHQFYTWTREVKEHTAGGSSFKYDKNLPGLAHYATEPKAPAWAQNQFVLVGKLEALDAPGEWFLDKSSSNGGAALLHLYTPSCTAPGPSDVAVKVRDYAFFARNIAKDIRIEGPMTFFGASAWYKNCTDCGISNVQMLYPTYDREIPTKNIPKEKFNTTSFSGLRVTLENVTLSYSINGGIGLTGDGHIVRNCAFSFISWYGTLDYVPLSANGNNITITQVTVNDFGNAGVTTHIPNVPPSAHPVPQPMAERRLEVSYTHIYRGGLVGKDSAALYTGGWSCAGVHWHHNWVHDATEKCVRADDQSRNMTVHHNVIYNCGMAPLDDSQSGTGSGVGLILKGTGHVVYANTFMSSNYTEMCIPSCPEPYKAWVNQYPLIEQQNNGTQMFNTAAKRDVGFPCSCHSTNYTNLPGGNQSAIFQGADLKLSDPKNFDFRPAPGSPLVDAGVVFPPYTDGYAGSAPDIGAYESGQDLWKAGCQGLPGC